uniref:granulin 1 n=1 Tax=Pristiophorus japonicus TaxID=55135 RepID=UPI00398F634D
MWPLITILLLENLASAAMECPDGSPCPDQSTCCKLQTGNYACCPMEKTVCCYKGTSCCPKDYTGDFSPSTMALEYLGLPLESKTLTVDTQALSNSVSSDSSVIHRENVYSCQNGKTCCRLQSGGWSYCPQPATVCCYEGTRCCPKDYTGDFSPSTAALKYLSLPLESKTLTVDTEALSNSISSDSSVTYCDNGHYCQDGNTCCRSQSGVWSCCPHPAAVCCKDGVHCCPQGTICDTQRSMCETDTVSIPWVIKKPALMGSEALQNSLSSDGSVVRCDDSHVCKAGSTCCKMYNKEWGCCPFPKAHCCWDGRHCCPKYHYCDVKRHRCRSIFASDNWSQLSSVKNAEESKNL